MTDEPQEECPDADASSGYAGHDMDLFGCRRCGAEWTRSEEIQP